MKDKTNSSLENNLRQKAEEFLQNKSLTENKDYSDFDFFKLVNEIEVHQIELEMQYDALDATKIKAETEAEKYTNLYDFGPAAHFTISKKGEIVELNFSAANLLGKDRLQLQNKRFAYFIANESQPIFNAFIDELFKNRTKQTCEIVLQSVTKIPTHVYVAGIIADDADQCILTVVDISTHKKTEELIKNSQILLHSTLESQIDTIIFSIDKEYNYLSFNTAHSSAMKLAYQSDIQVGMNILDCISSIDDRKIAKENYDRALAGETHSNIRVFGDAVKDYFESFFNPIRDANHKIIGATGLARNITKRIQSEEKLIISEEKYRTLFESNRDSITIFRFDKSNKPSNFLEANPATKSIFGYSKKDLLTLNISDIEIFSNKKRASLKAILLSKGKVDFETIIKNKKGEHRYVEVESMVINYLNGQAVMNITRDITERKQNEANAQKAQGNLTTILEAIPDLLFEVNLDGLIYFYQGTRTDLLAVPENEFIGKKFKDLLPADAANVCLEAIKEALSKGWSIGKQYSLLLPQGQRWFELSVSPIKEAANKIPHFIMLARDITGRKNAEAELVQQHSMLNSILESSTSSVFAIDNTYCYTCFNHAHAENMRRIYGVDIEIGHSVLEYQTVATDREIARINLDRALSGERFIESGYSGEPGLQRQYYEVTHNPIHDATGKVVGVSVYALNITDRKQAEIALQKSQKKLQGIFNVANSGIVMIDQSGKFLLYNDWCCKLLGYTRTEFQELNTTLLSHPEDLKRSNLLNKKIIDGKIDHYQIEKRYIKKDGSSVWCEISASGIKDQDDHVVNIIGVINDITERKKAKIELQNSEARLIETQTLAKVGSWETDFTFKKAIWSMETARIYGIDEKATQFTLKEFLSIVHPEDRILVQTEFVHSIKKQGLNKLEHRIITWAGIEKFVEQRWKIIRDDQGQLLRAVGSCHDITERKVAENDLKESKHFAIATLDALSAQIAILDQNGCIVAVNSAWLHLKESSCNQPINQNPIIGKNYLHVCEAAIGPYSYEAHMMATGIRSVMNEEQDEFLLEYPCHSPTEQRWFNARVTRFVSKGEIRIVVSHANITQRKLAEDRLIESERFLHQTQIIANLGSYTLDLTTRKWTSTSILDQIFGIDANYERTNKGWQKILHPEWREIMNDYMENEVLSNKISYNKDYKIIKIDSRAVRWVHGMGEIIFSDEGKPLQLIGSIQDITEQKQAEETLRESEEKYRNLVENSPDGIVIYIENKIAFINQQGIKMLGATHKEEIIGKTVLQFVHPDSLENIVQKMMEVRKKNHTPETTEEILITTQRKPFDAEIKAIPTFFEHKAAVQIIVHDISERKKNALELSKINRVYALLSQINDLILRTHNKKELFKEICNIAVNIGKFRMSWIGLLNVENYKIMTSAFAGHEEGYFTKSNVTSVLDVREGRGPTGIALREGRTVICNDIATDPLMEPWRKDALARGYCSMISIPIIVRHNNKIGNFNLYSTQTNFFSSEEEIALLEKIVLNIAYALDAIQIEQDRKQSEEKIRQLSQAVEQSPVSIIITNVKGKIEYVNPKFVESTGFTADEVVGKNPRLLKSGHTENNEYKNLWQTLLQGKEWHGEFNNKRKDGSFFWESATVSPIQNKEGKITHFIAIKEDITERKNAEQELINAKLRAEESDRLKLVFLANMSHEIRTPMNGILGFTELLKAPHLTGKKQQEYINIIEKSGKRMLNIINDIISISKIESGLIEVNVSKTNINEEIKYINNFFQLEAKQKGIQLYNSKELAKNYSVVKTDREKLYAILSNLVKNAIKFTSKGTIEFGCEKKGDGIEFFVKDSGIGISQSQKNIIFERFRQANETVSRSHEGSGLGLPISKAYVEMLGGEIWVESEEGKGSTFYFTVPFRFEPEIQEKTAVEKNAVLENDENKINHLKVLIVEDDAISKLLISIAVKPFSKEILKVNNGLEAIDACRANPDINLVMMDINMPEMDGYEATKQIREFNKDLVIIAQTANGMQGDRDNAIAAGCTDYISKPINIISLSKLIHQYFKK